MTIIGIVAQRVSKIASLLKSFLSKAGKSVVVADCEVINTQILNDIKSMGVEYLIISFKKGSVRPLCLDILILDDPARIEKNLIKCVFSHTRLIYNADSAPDFRFMHPNAISYGMSYASDATLSSIDDKLNGTSIIFCLQRPIKSLLGDIVCEGEFLVETSKADINVEDILAAVTCSILCKIPIYKSKKAAYLFM